MATHPRTLCNGRYEVLEIIGEGGMATVYRVLDRETSEERALKLLGEEWGLSTHWRSRFQAEARVLSRLAHPNVLRVHDWGLADEKYFYLTSDYANAGNAWEAAGEQGMSVLEALRVTFLVLAALEAAHRHGIIHRDVKPANVLLGDDGAVLLADFGIARMQTPDAEVQHRTLTGLGLGTVGYVSPEIRLNAREATSRSDVYGVGATLYAILRGVEPADLALVDASSPVLARFPKQVAVLIAKSTAWDPADRYPTARDMAMEVARIRDELAAAGGLRAERSEWMAVFDSRLEGAPPSTMPPTPFEPRGDSTWAGSAALFVGAAAGGTLLLLAGVAALIWALG